MLKTKEIIKEIQDAGRWRIILSHAFFIDEDAKVIVLNRHDFETSLRQLMDWAEEPGKNRVGRFYLVDLNKSQRKLCEEILNNKFVLCEKG
jgi:hypothetical protein